MKNFYVGIGFFLSAGVARLAAFDSASFSPHVEFAAPSGQVGLAFGDLDGDGKPDAVTANYSSGSVSVYRNTSTGGVVNGSTFAARVNFTTGGTPVLVRLVDLDGDGRLDIVCVNQAGNSLSLLRNTATSGVINSNSFAPKLDLSTTSDPRWVTVADLDGDGKPDLASATYNSGKLSLFQNHSTPGTLSFAARADLTPASSAPTIEAGDIDGDGHPDLIVTYAATSALSVYRNIHAGGALAAGSFAAPVDFATGNGASIALADLDGDGKLDVLTANASDNTLSVLRNIGTPGELTSTSLAARVSFNTGSSGVGVGSIAGGGVTPCGAGAISSRLRGASPNPELRIHCANVFHNTYARKHTRMCDFTRDSFWCQIGRIDSSSFAMRNAHSASVS